MELTQLRYFQKVARTKRITKAAQDLYISQPTLSQSLSRLESSLGCPLFTHQPGKRMQLNESGELFLKTVDRLFEELEQRGWPARYEHPFHIGVTIGVHTGPTPIGVGLLRRENCPPESKKE